MLGRKKSSWSRYFPISFIFNIHLSEFKNHLMCSYKWALSLFELSAASLFFSPTHSSPSKKSFTKLQTPIATSTIPVSYCATSSWSLAASTVVAFPLISFHSCKLGDRSGIKGRHDKQGHNPDFKRPTKRLGQKQQQGFSCIKLCTGQLQGQS